MGRFRRTALFILLLASIPVFAYWPRQVVTPLGLAFERWADSSFPISWRLNTTRGGNIAGARSVADAARAAFASWAGVGTAAVSFAEGATTNVTDAALDGINLISVAPVTTMPTTTASLTTIYSFNELGVDPFGRRILFPGQIVEADVVFNPNVQFTSDATATAGRLDLETRMRHEIGHLLGLDHSGLLSSVMFPTLEPGVIRPLALDDQIGLSLLYPSSAFWTSRGTMRGTVKTPAGVPVFGAQVVVADASGRAIVSALTDPEGQYQVPGLEPGNYSAHAEPLDGPINAPAVTTLSTAYPNRTVSDQFTTRFAVQGTAGSPVTLAKTVGDGQTALAGQALSTLLEVEARGANNAPLQGVTVTFRAASGGGAVVPIEAVTDSQGKAKTKAYLGSGANQAFTAAASSSTVTFTATGQTPTISSIAFIDPSASTVARELAVNEGNTVQARLRVLDSTGRERTDVAVSYSILDPDIATVSASGNVQGVKAGFTTLTVSGGGVISTAAVTVAQVGALASTSAITGVAQDAAQRLYLAARQDHTVLLVPGFQDAPQVYAGVSQTPGFQDDLRLQSRFQNPSFLAFNQADGSLYVADSVNNRIRRIQPGAGGRVETVAGTGAAGNLNGDLATATFNNPQGLALDKSGNIWVADAGNHTIRKINLVARSVTTVAGLAGNPGADDGSGTQARFSSPMGIAIESESLPLELDRFHKGGAPPALRLLVADSGNGTIRRIRETGTVETLVSPGASAATLDEDGSKHAALLPNFWRFISPTGIAMDPSGNIILTEPSTGRVLILLRSGDVVPAAQPGTFQDPRGVVVTQSGKVVVAAANAAAHEIRYAEPEITSITPSHISSRGGEVVTIQGKNFGPDTIVVVRGVLVPGAQVENAHRITFTAPAFSSGLTTLTLQHRGGLAQRALLIDPVPLSALPAGNITTVAGGSTFVGDGAPAPAAALAPAAAAVDSEGNIYIADTGNHRIRKVNPRTGIITTVAGTGEPRFLGDDGPSTAAALSAPSGVAVDIAGNLYIADTGNSRIRKVNANGTITTIAGNGDQGFSGENVAATSAALNFPWGVAVDGAGNVFVADTENDRVRKIAAGTGIITTIAGSGVRGFGGDNGPAAAASLSFPEALAIDASGNVLIVDTGNHRIRKVTGTTITTIAGTSTAGATGDAGPATAALLNEPGGIALDQSGNMFIADTSNHRIRMITAATNNITTVAGTGQFDSFDGDNGLATSAKLYYPQNAAVDGSGNVVVVDTGNLRVRVISAQTAIIKTKAGSGQRAFPGNDAAATAAALGFPEGMTIEGGGNIYIADGNQVRKVSASTGTITVVAGTGEPGFSVVSGAATAAMLSSPTGLAIDGNGNLFISDSGNHMVRKVNTATGAISLVAGTGNPGFFGDNGSALAAQLNTPLGLVLDSNGNLFVADAANNRIRKIDGGGVITTVVGGTSSVLSFPTGLALHPSGDLLVADTLNSRIRSVVTGTGAITTVAGSGTAGFSGDNGAAASAALFFPFGVAADSAGNIYIADTFNARVRRVGTNGVIRTVAGTGQVLSAGDDGAAAAASIFLPVGVRFDPSGNLYIIDAGIISRIRAVKGPIP